MRANQSSNKLAEFKINFYVLLLVDVNMPKLNGFELSGKILELDLNVRACNF
jgi:CheY-like chemotaxis protein